MNYMNSMQNVLFWDKESFIKNKTLDFIKQHYDQAKIIKHKYRKEKLKQIYITILKDDLSKIRSIDDIARDESKLVQKMIREEKLKKLNEN